MPIEEGRILLIDKPQHWTSFDVVNKIRIAIKKKTGKNIKTGHAGTLDPLATGLLIVCLGKATKQVEQLQSCDKIYTGKILLGKTTPSYDLETPFDSSKPVDNISQEMIKQAAAEIEKQTLQYPPVYSAIKKNGRIAYKEARSGREMKLEERPIKIHYFHIINIEMPYVSFEIKCSKGTYIRSVAHDFGKILGCGACLAELRRIGVGKFSVEDAFPPEQALEKILKEL